jgi:hypothetical protein
MACAPPSRYLSEHGIDEGVFIAAAFTARDDVEGGTKLGGNRGGPKVDPAQRQSRAEPVPGTRVSRIENH